MDHKTQIISFISRYLGTTKKEKHYSVYILCLILLGIGLPVSRFLMSVSMFCLSINWLVEGDLKRKMGIVFSRKSLFLILSIYLLHVIGLVYSNDYSYGIHDLKKKLPFLVLFLIIGTSEEISTGKMKTILKFFIATVFTGSLISAVAYIVSNSAHLNARHISLFISHIRFSLMVVMAIFIILYMFLFKRFSVNNKEKTILILIAIWLICFLFILQSFTGIWIFMVIFPVIMLNWIFRQKKLLLTTGVLVVLFTGAIVLFSIVYKALKSFYPTPQVNIETLDDYTVNGNRYTHYTESKILENGNYVYLYICEHELRKEWNKVSNTGYDSADNKGQELRATLIRYLTSKGFRKDSVGIASLGVKDIKMIENGFSNYIFRDKFSIYPRIYQFFWELDVYKKTGISGGHSLAQRIEYQKNGIEIIKRNFWFGVGTGDVQAEFNHQYKISNSNLPEKLRLRAHNQLLTFFITFGAVGFAWIMFSFVFSIIYEKKYKDFLTMIFLLVVFLSMLNEDTLESLAGICFFSFFYAMFVFGYRIKEQE